jgi:putative ABC transport system permease protein
MTKLELWLRWSWRDLRERWLQVTAIALIIALGTAVYVGLGSTTPWRTESAKASYELLNMYDLRVVLTRGSYIEQDRLLAAIRSIEHAGWIAAIEPRLITPTFVSVLNGNHDILVRGELVGVDVSGGGPHVNGIHVTAGRALTQTDTGQPVALLEYHFGDYYHLAPQGQIELSGGVKLDYVGLGMSPEYFMITTEEGGMWAQANFAAVFTPLETAQTLTDHPNMANNAVMTLTDEADRDIIRAEIDQALTAALPDVGFSLRNREENTVYHLVFQSITMNQQVYNIMIILFMAGAIFGAANLASRIVEAQRRQIGIGMALGMSPRWLAIRPLLVGAQIAVLGAFFGLVLGLLVGKIAQEWMVGLIPMPIAGDLFQTHIFLRAAALGLILPFAATIYPVWRAVRVQPVDAIKTGHLIGKGNGLAPLLSNIPTPGRSFSQMPVRNLLRSPRRTLLTVLGIATAITTLIGLTGMLDSASRALDQIKQEAYQNHPGRLTVFLNNVYPIYSGPITDLSHSSALATTEPALRVPGSAIHGDTEFRVLIEALDLDNDLWTPTVTAGHRYASTNRPGVLISRSAAVDLGIDVGDTFILELPRRTGLFTYQMIKTEVEVTGLHADPWRMFVYMDYSQAGLMDLDGMANVLYTDSAAEDGEVGARRALFESPHVASIVSVQDSVKSTGSVLDEVIRFLSGVQIAVLALAFLIAFNSTNINISERAREIATMFAFGVPVRTVIRMTMLENCITGILGTLLGFGFGALILIWFVTRRMPVILPEMRLSVTLSITTVTLAFLVGVVVVTLTPLLTVRKMARMDIPSALRVME